MRVRSESGYLAYVSKFRKCWGSRNCYRCGCRNCWRGHDRRCRSRIGQLLTSCCFRFTSICLHFGSFFLLIFLGFAVGSSLVTFLIATISLFSLSLLILHLLQVLLLLREDLLHAFHFFLLCFKLI